MKHRRFSYVIIIYVCFRIEDLREAIRNMELAKADEVKKNEQIHKSNLYSLINCVDTLAALHNEIEKSDENGDFKIIKNIANEVSNAHFLQQGFTDQRSTKPCGKCLQRCADQKR